MPDEVWEEVENPTNSAQSVILCLELFKTGSGAPAGDVSSDLAPQLLTRRAVRIYPSPWVYPAAPCATRAAGSTGERWELQHDPCAGRFPGQEKLLVPSGGSNSSLVGESALLDVFRDESGGIYLDLKHRDNGIYG